MKKQTIKIAPSILSADFSCLGKEIADVSNAGADYIHVDVMDGHFVPNLTIGPVVIKSIRPATNLPFDVHLMIENPGKYIKEFSDAGADIITFHHEAVANPSEIIKQIKSLGKKAGISIKPKTNPEVIKKLITELDLILVMSVEPGFGGQSFMPDSLDKLKSLRQWIDESGKNIDLEVDGGINPATAKQVIAAGANVLVAGSAIFKHNPDDYYKNIELLRS